ncbi:hypothetical protein PV326_009487 [Microctonus aethiopoides]|nr:hypothetical protein PV326_009487 [Microctonus aethiopoides]
MYGILLFLTFGSIIVPQHEASTSVLNLKSLIHEIDTSASEFAVTTLVKEISEWVKSGVMSQLFTNIIKNLAIPTEMQRSDWTKLNGPNALAFCIICKSFTKTIINLRRTGTPEEVIKQTIITLCIILNLQTEPVCRGVVNLNTPVILYIIDNDVTINERDVCGLLLQDQMCVSSPLRYEWTININTEPPKLITKQPSQKSLKILQITDLHYDPLYEPGGNAGCDEPTCCRRGQNKTGGNTLKAGYWGDFNNCDVPWHAVVDALDHMKEQHENIDLIYFTGDVIDHGVWETSREGNTKSLVKNFNKMKDIFGNTPIYPIVGNHEPNPVNLFAPNDIEDDQLSTRWLYQLLSDLWINYGWLPESTRETILRGGYYTLSPQEGFRIIAINNNVCYVYNWWLIYKPNDPSGQLQWLENTLLKAENDNESVHILGHIPSGDSTCQHTWSREYRRIINRYSHIITAQFNGHTHNDEFNVFYDLNDKTKLINVAWNGGSITPYAYLNPNYKIYIADSNTYVVEDIETWMYNLTNANETPEKRPLWFNSYSFKNEYKLSDLSNESLNKIIVDMAKGSPILEVYHKNFFKHAAPELEKECDKPCLQSYVCRIVTTSSDNMNDCEYFKTINSST